MNRQDMAVRSYYGRVSARPRAVVLLSGGVDSATAAALTARDGFDLHVPARNTIFLAFALAWSEVLGASDIVIGVNSLDYSGYPDCRPEYIEAFERMAALATRAGVEGRQPLRIRTPLIRMTKAEIIRAGTAVALDYSLTLSCYDPAPDGAACGRCDACALRRKGFEEAQVPDPTPYRG
jgi:7-cyano-7-deazaguanine synthase